MTEDFYSIVYVSPNHLTNERISIGLIVVSNGVPYFKFSMTKLKWLSYDEVKAPVKKHMQEIEEIIKEEQSSKVLRLFNYRFASDVFSELSSKSKGMVVFDKPAEVHSRITNQFFDKLFYELIGAKPNKKAEKKSLPMRVKWTHWLRRQDSLSGFYKYEHESFPWVHLDYAIVSKDSINVFHCVDPEISKKSFKQAISKLELIIGVLNQEFNQVNLNLIHGDKLSDSGLTVVNANSSYNWISFEKAKQVIK